MLGKVEKSLTKTHIYDKNITWVELLIIPSGIWWRIS
jgi:hypothetical protein